MDKRTIHNLSKGDRQAMKDLFDYYAPVLYRYVFSILKSDVDAQEITQLVFIKLWDIRSSLRDNTNFTSFVLTIARNTSYNYLKKKYREKMIFSQINSSLPEIDTDNIQTEDMVLEKELKIKLEDLIDKLPLQRKKIFKLSRYDGKTYHEIAGILGISENTVDTQIRKALRYLKENLADEISLVFALFLINIF